MQGLWHKEDGSVPILVVISLAALIGIAAFAVDAGHWFGRSTKISNVADASAISGATITIPFDVESATIDQANTRKDLIIGVADSNLDIATLKSTDSSGDSTPPAVTRGSIAYGCWRKMAPGDPAYDPTAPAKYDFFPGVNCHLGGNIAANAVKVTSTHRDVPSIFARIFEIYSVDISRSATAAKLDDNSCLTVLDNDDDGSNDAMTINGLIAGSLNFSNCAAQINGMINSGGGNDPNVQGTSICANGGTDNSNLQGVIQAPCGQTVSPTVPTYPDTSVYSNQPFDANAPAFVPNKVYTGNIKIKSSKNITMPSGLYVFRGKGTKFDVDGTLTAYGVTLVFESGATFNFNGVIRLTAPNDAPSECEGLSNWHDYVIIDNVDNSSPPVLDVIQGNAGSDMIGNVYLQDHELWMHGTTDSASLNLSFVVYKFRASGNTDWNFHPGPCGPKLPLRPRLVQ